MKKFLTILSLAIFLSLAGAAQADWVKDIPKPKGINYLGIHFNEQGTKGEVTIKTKSGDCAKYIVVNNEIVKTRKCADPDWTKFIKNDKQK